MWWVDVLQFVLMLFIAIAVGNIGRRVEVIEAALLDCVDDLERS